MKHPRTASTYRGERRNAWRAAWPPRAWRGPEGVVIRHQPVEPHGRVYPYMSARQCSRYWRARQRAANELEGLACKAA